MFIEDYTPKSFIVRGDDTVNYKDSLRDMGGKWNDRLTDKVTGEKFGAWIFWADKRVEITKWMVTKPKVTTSRNGVQISVESRLANMEAMIGELVLVIQKMNPSCKESLSKTKFYQTKEAREPPKESSRSRTVEVSGFDSDVEEEEDVPPPRRLLRK